MEIYGYKEVTECHCYAGDHRVLATGAFNMRKIPKCPTHKGAMQVLSVHQVKNETSSVDCAIA